ncbi:MAG: hypothetical protein RL329_712 [Bacteroidota bacterium]|jgi:isopenicillin N synthase-like dioxygenase
MIHLKQKRAIPLVDVSTFTIGSAAKRAAFVSKLGNAFHEVGFVGIVQHGIPSSLIADFYRLAKSFFALSQETKNQAEKRGSAGQRGYTTFGKEHAKHSKVPDLKEFFQIGQTVSDQHPNRMAYSDNVLVPELPEFSSKGLELYRAFEKTGGHLLRAIALHLHLEEDFFESKIQDGNSILRAIHYPPIAKDPGTALRSEQHEDINLITLLVGASAGGLQLLNKDGIWEDIVPEADEIVINVGDMLQRLTNNYLKSTTHRVINPPKSEWHQPRLSIPFFMHPVSEMDLTCLPSLVTAKNPVAYPPITAGAYLNERLREIGLK